MRKIVVVALTCLLLVVACHDESRQAQPLYPEDMIGSWECVSNPDLSLEFGEHGTLWESKQYAPTTLPITYVDRISGETAFYYGHGFCCGELENDGLYHIVTEQSDLYFPRYNDLWVSFWFAAEDYPCMLFGTGGKLMFQDSGRNWHFGDYSMDSDARITCLHYAWEADGDILRFTRMGNPRETPFTHFELDDDTLSLAWGGEWLTFRRR